MKTSILSINSAWQQVEMESALTNMGIPYFHLVKGITSTLVWRKDTVHKYHAIGMAELCD